MKVELPVTVKEVVGEGGLSAYDVQNQHGSLRVYRQGAHVTSWVPTGHRPVLWMSKKSRFAEGVPIRGGIPICFPWFGFGPKGDQKPIHGNVRTQDWELERVSDMGDRIWLSFCLDGQGYRLMYEILFTNQPALRLKLMLSSLSGQTMACESMLHTYFAVGDARQTYIKGLQGMEYIDRAGGGSIWNVQREEHICFGREVDRLYMDHDSDCLLTDPTWMRRMVVKKNSSQSTVAWNPGPEKAWKMSQDPGDFGAEEWLEMACIESGNAGERNILQLGPGTHTLAEVRIIPYLLL